MDCKSGADDQAELAELIFKRRYELQMIKRWRACSSWPFVVHDNQVPGAEQAVQIYDDLPG